MDRERCELVLEVTSEGFWDLDLKTDRAYLSPRYCELIGYSPEDTVFDSTFFKSIIHPEDYDHVSKTIEEHRHGRNDLSVIEFRLISKNGAVRWFEGRGKIVEYDDQGVPARMVGTIVDISSRIKAAGALKRSESDLAAAQALTRVGSWRINFGEEGEQWSCSDEIYRIYGYPLSMPLTMQTGFDRIHPEDREHVSKAWTAAMEGTGPREWKHRIIVDGRVKWIDVRARFIFDPSGKLIEASGTNQDITDQKLLKIALQESEERYRTIFEVESDALLLVDCVSFRFIDANEAASKMYGYSREEFLQLTAMDMSAEKDATEWAISTKEPKVLLRWHRRKDGSVFPVEIASTYFEINGRTTHVAAIRDISERKQAESALRESEARFSTIFHSSPIAIGISRLDNNKIVDVNKAFLALFGYARDEVLSHTSMELSLWLDPEEREKAIQQLQNSGRVQQLEAMFRHKSGSIGHLFIFAEIIELGGEKFLLGMLSDISNLKRSEKAREEALGLLKKVTNRVPGVVYQYRLHPDGSSCLPYTSEGIREIYRLSPEEVREDASKVLSVSCPDDLDGIIASIQKSARDLTPWNHEYRTKFDDGTVRWLLGNALPEREGDGSVLWHGFITDITKRKRTEEMLAYSVSLANAALESSANGILVVDMDGKIARWNRKFVDLFQVPEELLDTQIKDDPVLSYVTALMADPEGFMSRVRELYERPEEASEDTLLLADGRIFERYSQPLRIDHQIMGRFWSFRDVTERKQAENTRNEALELLQKTTSQVPGLVYQFRLSPDGSFSFPFVSDGLRDLFQVGPEEARADSSKVFSRIHPDDFGTVVSSIQKSALDLAPWRQEYRVIHDDGSVYWLLGDSLPQGESDGSVLWYGFTCDITERKQAEEKLMIAKVQAESANRAKSEFLANMSHEIRTPMNGVLGMAQLLEMTELTEEQREYVTALKLSGKNLLTLINDILDLSKIEAGKITIESHEFNLRRCIDDIVLQQKLIIFEKGLSLDVGLSGDIPLALAGDQHRVKQIISNLVSNAVKFTPPRGAITISAQVIEQQAASVRVQIAVKDSGIGISPDLLEYIFQPFVQADGSTTRKFGGTGLGLTISRRLAELMGGSISVESTPGKGSCFRFTLPFAFITRADAVQEALSYAVPRWVGPQLRVLFVEDDPVNVQLGLSLFKKLGHEVVSAGNGRECLAALEHGRFDLVLMDIQMPDMNGEEALYEIRRKELGTTLHQPVIALTAYALRGEKERFLAQGFDGYVSKPLDLSELISEMKRIVV
jgi:PAS domain S-box-containing protein